jgi:hypothetical protein
MANMFEKIKGIKNNTAVLEVNTSVRKKGKSSDPDFMPTNVYLRKELIKKAKTKLIQEDFDFSDLVNRLVEDWVNKENSK